MKRIINGLNRKFENTIIIMNNNLRKEQGEYNNKDGQYIIIKRPYSFQTY